MATEDSRTHAQSLMRWLVNYRPQINYRQVRPMWTVENLPHEQSLASYFYSGHTIYPDCSEITTLICKYAGYRDPNGSNYDSYGNSQTMYNNLGHELNPKKAGTGMIVEYKVNGVSVHVNMVYKSDTNGNPILFNHGSPAGPALVDYKTFTTQWLPNYVPTFLIVGPL